MLVCPECRRPYPAGSECPACKVPLHPAGGLETLPDRPAPEPAGDLTPTQHGEPTTLPAAAPAAAAAPLPGTAFGRYRLESALGEGGMGVVWKARDTELQRTVALKQVKLERVGSEETLQRFLREARVAAKLRHPNIVGVYDVGCCDGQHFITMEYIEGRTLAAWLAETGAAKRAGARRGLDRLRSEIRLLADIAAAVAYAHGEGIIHRDLKPSNVILDREDRPFVMDFGLAKEVSTAPESGATPVSHPLTLSGQVLGTPAYMSPEQVDGDPAAIGPRGDVWALGVVLYEILTGRLPFGSEAGFRTLYAVLQNDPPRPRQLYPHVPEELEAVCLKALEKEPARRYATAREFGEEFQRWLRGEPVQARKQTLTYRLWRRLVRRRTVLIPTAAALAIVLAALAWGWRERTRGIERTFAMLRQITPQVARFEDLVMQKPMDADTRGVLAEQPLAMLDQLVADAPEFGPAWSWRGRVERLVGLHAEADRDFDQGCALSPAMAVPRLLRGLDRIERYARARGLPSLRLGAVGLELLPGRPDTPYEEALREGGLADLDAAERAPDAAGLDDSERRIARTHAAFRRGRPEEYARLLAALEGLDTPKAWGLRGQLHYSLLHFPEAEQAWRHALDRWPRDSDGWCSYGDALLAIGLGDVWNGRDPRANFASAIVACGNALEIDARSVRARFNRGSAATLLAEAEAKRGADPRERLRSAIADFDAASALSSDRPLFCNNRGNAWLDLGLAEQSRGIDPGASYARAQADFAEALRVSPAFPEPAMNLAATALALGDVEEQRGADSRPRYLEAIAVLDALLARRPDHAQALGNRGRARVSLGEAALRFGADPREEFRRALADLDAALALEPKLLPARDNRGNTWVQLELAEAAHGGDPLPAFDHGIADLSAAIALDPGDAEHFSNRGLARQRLAEYLAGAQRDAALAEFARALADFDDALRLNPRLVAAWNNRGGCGLALEDLHRDAPAERERILREAEADFDQALGIHPGFADAINNRGLARQGLGELDELAGRDPRPLYRQAIADFDESIRLRSQGAPSWNNRGIAGWTLGRAEEARGTDPGPFWARAEADYRKAAELHMDAARLNLGLLYSDLGRYEEAIAEFAAGAQALPAEREWARRQIEQTRLIAQMGGGWRFALAQAGAAYEGGDLVAARLFYEKGFTMFDAALKGLAPEERERRCADAKLRSSLAAAHFARACLEAASLPLGEARAAAVDRAFVHLARAAEFGYQDDLEPIDEVEALAPLRDDPRFAGILERVR